MLALVIKWTKNAASTEHPLVAWTRRIVFVAQILGTFLFFDRDVRGRSNPLSRSQLSTFHHEIGVSIISVIKRSPETFVSPFISQLQELLMNPLTNMPTKPSIVLVLDTAYRKALLDALAENQLIFPPRFVLLLLAA